ncbi:autoinducer 2-binding protein LsrB-like [Saccostrea echinata]|uniref:autoinducer 2-binding protein LsrB-like n=1 Tax=Saccostrea echinata TaxID=191078 RepID=UPI002A82C270|nr:autoinducer 2-binding protein LsrB-like [Saccostrea echinata]
MGQRLGVDVIYTGPSTADASEQVRILEDMISRGVSAIAVAPNDAAAVTPVLIKARNAGIAVLDWDTPADESVVDYSVQQVDSTVYARHMYDLLVQNMGESGDYAVVTGGLSAENLNIWIDEGLEYAKVKYPGLTLVTQRIPSDEKQQLAYQKTLDLLKAYPNLKGILGYSTPAPIGVAQAVQEKGLQSRIAVVGVALPTDSGPYLEDGSLDVATLWDPGKLGALTVYVASELLNGRAIADGQDVPGVGRITVRGKVIVMGPPSDFTKENYKDYTF